MTDVGSSFPTKISSRPGLSIIRTKAAQTAMNPIFSVSYDTDINLVPALVEAAVSKHPEVLNDPFPPDCELRGFGESGINFAVKFWVNGIDDGKNKYTSDVLYHLEHVERKRY